MRVFDFDKTIFHKDSTATFYFFLLRKKPSLVLHFPVFKALGFKLGIVPKLKFKQAFYSFLKYIDVDDYLTEFWDKNMALMHKWYIPKSDYVIISASPEFLLEIPCARLGVGKMMASRVDKHTGEYTGENCWGEEKVKRFYEAFPSGHIEEFYSDSYSDSPLALISDVSYLVDGETLKPWKN